MTVPEKIFVTADVLVFTIRARTPHVLLIRRKNPPWKGRWALPGGFVEPGESVEAAALRELAEETGVRGVRLEQLYTFGELGRDPRGRVVTVAYLTLIAEKHISVRAGDDAGDASFWPVSHLPSLAFDHAQIIRRALRRLREGSFRNKILSLGLRKPDKKKR